MENFNHSDEVLSDLTLSEAARLKHQNDKVTDALTQHLGIPESYSFHNKVQAISTVGAAIRERRELESLAKEMGYKSIATALYGLSRKKDTSVVPTQYLIAPEHVLKQAKNPTAEQKKWETEILPLMNGQLDDTLNDADWINLDWAVQNYSRAELNRYLLDVERRQVNGEFDEEIQEAKVREVLEERLLATKERLGLLPAPQTKLLAPGPVKDSVELKFAPTGVTSNADTDLGTNQLESLSKEDRELFDSLFSS